MHGAYAGRELAGDARAAGGDVTFAIDERAERALEAFLTPRVRLSANTELGRMFWTFGFRGRPARPLVDVLGDLIDVSSVRGGTFDLGSACFDVTRVITGQLDAYVEPGPLLLEVPGMREQF